jgi:RNA polymerase subunit RPABC4/transcription elongation factor Spt4
MAKICKKCNASVNSKSMECPYCGSANFEFESIEPVKNNEQTSSHNIQNNIQNNQNSDVYSNRLEQLINFALSDGELTEKEKQVLFKKAEDEGIDLDEFEMVLDAKLKQIKSSSSPSISVQVSNIQEPPPLPSNVNLPQQTYPNREAYSQLEYLIDMAVKDGVISDLESQTIFEKGIALNISRNEIEMILNAKIEDKIKLAAQTAAPKSDKLGDVKKCPACGSITGAFRAICSDCGHEFSNIEANNSSQKLYKELIRVEEEERNRPSENSGIRSLTSLITGGNDPLAEHKLNARIYKRKIGVVSMFPVPNTKADILEFLSLAVAEGGKKIGGFFSDMSDEEKEYIKAWRAKAEQVIIKARFSLKEDKKLLDEINNYAKQIEIK